MNDVFFACTFLNLNTERPMFISMDAVANMSTKKKRINIEKETLQLPVAQSLARPSSLRWT